MTPWVTSDTHFNHLNIIQYCRRPFVLAAPSKCTRCKGSGIWPARARDEDEYGSDPDVCTHPDVDAMNEEMVRRWNEVVGPDDVVYHLGDVFLGPREQAAPIIARLHGSIVLIKGNHDRLNNTAYRSMRLDPRKADHINFEGRRILLTHRPPREGLADYDLALCGHVHGAWKERVVQGKLVINVGVDVRGFRPVSLASLVGDLWTL